MVERARGPSKSGQFSLCLTGQLVDSRFCDVLSKLRHSECFSHPVEYRLFLLCLLRDNLLPLPNVGCFSFSVPCSVFSPCRC